MILSKQLLSEVLGIEVSEIDIKENLVYYFVDNEHLDDEWESINIYELAHKKCKEWALARHIRLWSIIDDNNSAICRIHSREKEEFYADSEPEAIFKACQWIYDKELLNDKK